MNKYFFSFVLLFFGCSAFSESDRYQAFIYESHLEAELDLGVVERGLRTVFDFFDQDDDVEFHLDSYQESMYHLVILPMYKKNNGKYKGMIRSIRSAHSAVSLIVKRLKRAGVRNIKVAEKRKGQLKRLLSVVRKRRGFVRTLWASAQIEERYGDLIASYKLASKRTGHVIVQDQEFEKSLLYISFNLVAHKHKKYPMVYFMRRFVNRDIEKHKRAYDRVVKSKKTGFASDLFEKKYHDLTLIKTSVESLDSYNKEKAVLSASRFKSIACWMLLATVAVGAVVAYQVIYDGISLSYFS